MSSLDFVLPEHLGGPQIELDNCAREPIHIPGAVQAHGLLLALSETDLHVLQVSRNCTELLGLSPEAMLGQPLHSFVRAEDLTPLQEFLRIEAGQEPLFAFTLTLKSGLVFDASAHRGPDGIILELEPFDPRSRSASFFHEAKGALAALEGTSSVQALCDAAAAQVRRLTGFDRVMIYRFDDDGHGHVIAEARESNLHSYLDLHFPESDIPAQARALYLQNLLRLTADVHAVPAAMEPPVNPQTGAPLDMSGAVLRATSPMHVQYLRNMGVGSSLSVSIVQEGRLWGLISCHHLQAKYVPFATRSALTFLGRVIALQLGAARETGEAAWRADLRALSLRLAGALTGTPRPHDALARAQDDLLRFTRAQGVALCLDGEGTHFGHCPSPEELRALVGWIREQKVTAIATNRLPGDFPASARFGAQACGLLGVSLSERWDEYLIWFRPEAAQTIRWGGDPNKPVEVSPDTGVRRLSPRTSFETYVQTVRHTSLPWHPVEVEAAAELRHALIEANAARTRALKEINARLVRANQDLERTNAELKQFAFITSHDLQEPLRQVSSFAELLARTHAGQIDEDGEEYLRFVVDGSTRLRTIINDLQAYIQIGVESQRGLPRSEVDLNMLLHGVLHELGAVQLEKGAQVTWEELPTVSGHAEWLRQVLFHLLDNALKFTGPQTPRVHVNALRREGAWQVSVQDNGVGIAREYHDSIFTIFRRLHLRDTHPGNGVGLAISRKIIEQHGGTLTVESEVGQGARFSFVLPDHADDQQTEDRQPEDRQ